MRSSLIVKILLAGICLSFATVCKAQKDTGTARYKAFSPAVRFIVNAPVLLPALHKAGKLGEMRNFADNWANSMAPSDEFIFAIHVLLATENNTVTIHKMPSDFMRLLDVYAKGLHQLNTAPQSFRYIIKFPGALYWYDATQDAAKLFRFTQAWAKDMLKTHKPDSTTSFICSVFAGSISKPSYYVTQEKNSYVEIDSLENSMDSIRQQCFVIKRNSRAATFHLLAGVWLPNGNLAVLGPHPSIGLQFGLRNKLNEYDITWSFRFLPPTPGTYNVLRQDTLYQSNYYNGGYIGFDYTRYFVHKASFEAGFIAGMGYDYFDAFNELGGSDNHGHNYEPANIGSFDFNAGLNLKYFMHRGPSIGIQAKYHCINYVNAGGTDLSGNAVTIDISFGAN